MATTDRGSNELWSKKTVLVQTKDVPSLFYLPSDCFEHLSHLGVLGALKLTDQLLKGHRPWKYYSSIAIVANTLRDLGQSLFLTWRALFGDADAVSKVKSLIPRCVAGRWGSIAETERRLLEAEVSKLSTAIKYLFETEPQLLENDKKVNKTHKNKKSDNGADAVDELAVEATQAFNIRLGKWRRHTWTVLQDTLFGKIIIVLHTSREPWMHLSHYVKKNYRQTLSDICISSLVERDKKSTNRFPR